MTDRGRCEVFTRRSRFYPQVNKPEEAVSDSHGSLVCCFRRRCQDGVELYLIRGPILGGAGRDLVCRGRSTDLALLR